MRTCPFCGNAFAGQKKNFEHVIPKWLVAEADLNSRQMEVNLETGPLSVGMNSIGSKACVSCNSEYGELEDQAKFVFLKIKDGSDLSSGEIEVFLDWLDKVRIGMWLWGLTVSKQISNIRPKFTINKRIGLKDRIVIIARYPPDKTGRGLEFWGATNTFFYMPSAFGFFANNIAFITISYEFLLLQHNSNISIPLVVYDQDDKESALHGGDIMAQFELSVPLKERLNFVGNPRIYDQTVVSSAVANKYIHMQTKEHTRISGYRMTNVYSLNSNLEAISFDTSGIRVSENINGILLMEMNVHKAMEYILRRFLQSAFSNIENAPARRAITERSNRNLFIERVAIENLKDRYYRQTGMIIA